MMTYWWPGPWQHGKPLLTVPTSSLLPRDAAGLEKRVAPDRNRLIYLWGHLSAMHDRMLSLLSVAERVHPEFDGIFIGTPDHTTELPSVEVIHAWWTEVNTRLNVGMARFSSSDWLAKHASVSEEGFCEGAVAQSLFHSAVTYESPLISHWPGGPCAVISGVALTCHPFSNIREKGELPWQGHSKVTGGRIIMIGSCLGERVMAPGLVPYSATKGAVKMFSQGLAREVGDRGITVNNVQPGPIDTDLNPASGDWATPQKAATALNRYGTVDEIASMVAFLAGPEAGYITGANFTVDGGTNA